jgi:squalene monooxygenase
MHESFTNAITKREFACMPNRSMPAYAAQTYEQNAGAILLGDSLNMRHPLTGGGMTVALSDVYNLSQHLLRDVHSYTDSESIDRSMKHHYATRSAPIGTSCGKSINIYSHC